MATTFTTGWVVRTGEVEWTTLQHKKGGTETVGTRRAAFDPAAGFKPLIKEARGALALALPAHQVLTRVVELPTTDPVEMQGMVDLQVDKFSPFPLEQMTVGFEVLEQKEGHARVLIAAVQRDVILAASAPFVEAGLFPTRVDVSALGWWHLLKTGGRISEEGRQVTLILDAGEVELIISEKGVPLVFRSLGPVQEWTAEPVREMVAEVAYSLTVVETERGHTSAPGMTVWHRGDEPPPALAEGLRQEIGAVVAVHSLDGLSSLSEGLALRAERAGFAPLNLVPAGWQDDAATRRFIRKLLLAVAVFWAVWLAGVGVFATVLHVRRSQLAVARADAEKLEKPATVVRELKEKIATFQQYADRTHSALEYLREISELLPEGVDINSFLYKKGVTVTVRGECAAPEPIYSFFEALQKSPLFVGVKPEGISSKNTPAGMRSQFSVNTVLPGGKQP